MGRNEHYKHTNHNKAVYRLPHPNTDDSRTLRAVSLPSVSAKNLEGLKVSGFGNAPGSLKIALIESDNLECVPAVIN